MLKPEQVPKEVIDAAYYAYWRQKPNSGFAEAIAAALNAWPGMEVHNFDGWTHAEGLILPLPTEASDE